MKRCHRIGLRTQPIWFIFIESFGNSWIVSLGQVSNQNRYKKKEAYIFISTCQLHNHPCMIFWTIVAFSCLLQFQSPLKEIPFFILRTICGPSCCVNTSTGLFPSAPLTKALWKERRSVYFYLWGIIIFNRNFRSSGPFNQFSLLRHVFLAVAYSEIIFQNFALQPIGQKEFN